MQYLLLIQEPKGQRAARDAAAATAAREAMEAFRDALDARGRLIAAQSLAVADTRRVTVRDGTARTLDGPFAEAKEIVGGFFLVECADMAEAEAIAADCPAARWATVEVRRLAPCDERPAAA